MTTSFVSIFSKLYSKNTRYDSKRYDLVRVNFCFLFFEKLAHELRTESNMVPGHEIFRCDNKQQHNQHSQNSKNFLNYENKLINALNDCMCHKQFDPISCAQMSNHPTIISHIFDHLAQHISIK